MYRYNRLDKAKQNAKQNGYKGAMYPWQSSDTGEEETPKIHYNPVDKTWGPDYSQNQRHVSIAVFYNFFKYITHSGDRAFLENYGVEVMVEIARFWASIAKFDNKTKKYHIKGVMGPDEFHEKYPHSKKPGIDDNAYTNVMVSWLFRKIIDLLKDSPQKIFKKLNIKNEELTTWRLISKNLCIPVKDGIILQFEGYDKLKELNWNHYKRKYKNISRLDRILKAEGKSPDSYKIAKQADVLMIFYLLEFDEAINILKDLELNIKNPKKFIENNYDYYLSRTTHGSNLSRFVHGIIALKLNREKSQVWDLFVESLKLDIYDTQGGTTQEGIHAGLMAGTINIVRKYFAGVKTHSWGLRVSPWMPKNWNKLEFMLTHKKLGYDFIFNSQNKKENLDVTLESGSKKSLIKYKDEKIILNRNKTKKIKFSN
jgi:trehalose/maltose hydrolase-like predicted phosphorylase